MLEVLVSDEGRKVTLTGLPLTPRTFAVRDEEKHVIPGQTGSVGYGFYGAIIIEGMRHQLTVNVAVNKSKAWTDDAKLEWIAAHAETIEAVVGGYADTFTKKANTGWRINSQMVIAGQACTASGSLILSGKTVKAAGEKAKAAAEREAREEAAVARHQAALDKARETKDKALAALKASVKA